MTRSGNWPAIASVTARPEAASMRRRAAAVGLSVVLGLCLAAADAAAQVFRYEEQGGGVVWSTSLPPEYADRGYEIYDARGQLVRKVAPQLTEAQLAARSRAEREARAREQAELEAYERDQRLMRLYSSASDVTRALQRRLAAIDGAINTTRGNIERLRVQQRSLEAQASAFERTRQPVSPEILRNLEIIDDQIEERLEEIEARKAEKDRMRQEFQADADRLRELYARHDG